MTSERLGGGHPPTDVNGFWGHAPILSSSPAVPRQMSDAEFAAERERRYLLAVQAAVAEVVESGAWLSELEAYTALAGALERRGIDPDPEAVLAGASLIARGRRPLILSVDLRRSATGQRRR